MQRYIRTGVLVLLIAAGAVTAACADSGYKGRIQRANHQNIFNKVTDSLATFGKTGTEKKQILATRKAQRRRARIKAEQERQRRVVQKRAHKRKQAAIKRARAQGYVR